VDTSRADGVPRVELDTRAVEQLARGVVMTEVAKELGISYEVLRNFRRRRAAEIEARRAELEAELRQALGEGVWITEKAARLRVLQDDAERIDQELAAPLEPADVATLIRTRAALLHAAAEELGQLPPRQLTVTQTIVNYSIEGLDMEKL
jgi:hypothetical protein